MALQFQPYPLLQQPEPSNAEQRQQNFQNLMEVGGTLANSATRQRQLALENQIRQAQETRAQTDWQQHQNAFDTISPDPTATLGTADKNPPQSGPSWGGNVGPSQSDMPGMGAAPGTYPMTPQPMDLADFHKSLMAKSNPSPMLGTPPQGPQPRFMSPTNPAEWDLYKEAQGMQNQSGLVQSEVNKNNAMARAEQGMTPQDMQDAEQGNWQGIGSRHGGVVPPKLVSSGINLGMKKDQFMQKEWDTIVKESNPMTASGRTGLGMAARADYNANRALLTLSKPIVTNQEAGNAMADIAQVYQGGSPTEYGMSHQGYNTLYGKLQGAIQSLTGDPRDALPDAIKSRLIGVLNEMKSTNKAVLTQQLDHIERAQPQVISNFKDQWQGIRQNLEQGIAGGPSDQGDQGVPQVGQTFNGARVLRVRRIR